MCDDNDSGIEVVTTSENVSTSQYEQLFREKSIKHYSEYLTNIRQEFHVPGRIQAGFVAYGDVAHGDKVLIAASNLHDMEIVEAIRQELKERGAKSVDVMLLDDGEDRELTYRDEFDRIIRREGWWQRPRWYDYQERVLNYAKDNGYNFLIHGRGGPIPKTNHAGDELSFKFEAIPWQTKEVFLSRSTVFPPKLNHLINIKTWNKIYKEGRGGRVRVTDPEGTDLEFTLKEAYYGRSLDQRSGFGPEPMLGHLFGHPTPPILEDDDTTGVIAGTTSHLTRPFPHIKVDVDGSKIDGIEGGGEYGRIWNSLLVETDSIQYPEFPRKGLFWFWEFAIGTNPKVIRPKNVLRISSGANETERSRSGVIHCGFGTRWRGESELWAASRGYPYGHLHVHLMFPTYRISKSGKTISVIENGRLQALDDPEVRAEASKYGDPDEILSLDWIPKIPGINMDGKYEDYSGDPAEWIRSHI